MLVLMTCLRLHVDETLSSGVDGSATGEPVTGPSPRAKLTGPQSRSFGSGASPSHLSFRPPMAKAVGVARRRQQLF
jgi:hypothetical protein